MVKRQKILDAAVQLLATNGLHATPMSAIARAAGTGMGTIYNYFSTKEVLINAIYTDIKQQQEALARNLATNLSIKEQFDQYYLSVLDFYLKNPDYYRFMSQLQGSPIITKESKLSGEEAVKPVRELFENGQKAGLIKMINVEELLQFTGGTLLTFLGWKINSNNEAATAIENQLRLVWDAIKS